MGDAAILDTMDDIMADTVAIINDTMVGIMADIMENITGDIEEAIEAHTDTTLMFILCTILDITTRPGTTITTPILSIDTTNVITNVIVIDIIDSIQNIVTIIDDITVMLALIIMQKQWWVYTRC